ncbi:MAG: hypothetical protein DI537_13635 [Stutzerimonas stutzeri]|nr:MAG: hypothetical protein DI537_13635 [Stutzerimonas stutzeri]
MRVLTNYAEETAKFTAQRAKAEVKLKNALTILRLLGMQSGKLEKLAQQIAALAACDPQKPHSPSWRFRGQGLRIPIRNQWCVGGPANSSKRKPTESQPALAAIRGPVDVDCCSEPQAHSD